MKQNSLWIFTVIILLSLASGAEAQKTKSSKPVKKSAAQKPKTQTPAKKTAVQKTQTKKPEATEVSQDEKKVRDMVAFLEYVLNTLGSSKTAVRDKDVLITESYSKIFRDNKVQVEDDLDEEREVITNKDIVAYLKDVDFFFQDAKFEFAIEDIKSSTTSNGKLFYKVALRRTLTATTAEGKHINNSMPRFIEINYNPEDQDLRIVSIYTNEFDESEALTNWWKELSYEWQAIFRRKLNLKDSVQLSDIKNITAIGELDLSNNQYIQDIGPLGQLPDLKLLNLSATNLNDLTPIRNLTELVELNLSGTKIKDLTPLKYSNKLVRLNIDNTPVTDISVVEKMSELQNLQVSNTFVSDLSVISNLTKLLNLNIEATLVANLTGIENLADLTELNIALTLVLDLTPLSSFKKLSVLTIDSTRIRNIVPLSALENLKILSANYTLISDLRPLQKLPHLERVYCDQTPITKAVANEFIAAHPKALVVFDSKDLKAWWETLSPGWQDVLSKTTTISTPPSKEELAIVTNLDSINFGDNTSITDLEPLRKLQKLKVIIGNKTAVSDLSPLEEHRDIRYLDISDTEVTDLSVISEFTKLKELRADRCKFDKIDPLFNIASLEKLYVDQTAVHDIIAQEFLEKNPSCLVVHKTNHLNRWWRDLSGNWRKVFYEQMGKDTTSTRENLHRLAEQETLHFKDIPVKNLSALSEFVRLKELHFSGTAITSIPALENIRSLRSLRATNSPLQEIEAIRDFTALEDLDISNTPVDDLKPIGSLQTLKSLNGAGTQLKKLDPLEKLENLEVLDCSNTKVNSLDPVKYLPLKTLICYNTKVSERDVRNFREANAECNVVYYR